MQMRIFSSFSFPSLLFKGTERAEKVDPGGEDGRRLVVDQVLFDGYDRICIFACLNVFVWKVLLAGVTATFRGAEAMI